MSSLTSSVVDPPARPQRRELNRLRTHRALEAAALELFAERGYAATTVEDIADRADVSLRTFFRYFPTKDRTVFNDLRPNASTMIEHLVALPATEDPWTRLCTSQCAQARQHDAATLRVIKARYRLIRSTPELLARHAEINGQEQQSVVEALNATTPNVSCEELRLLVSVAYTAIWHAVDRWASGEAGDDLPRLLEDSFGALPRLLTSSTPTSSQASTPSQKSK